MKAHIGAAAALAVALGCSALTGCGSGASIAASTPAVTSASTTSTTPEVTTSSSTTTMPPGPDAFVARAKASTIGDREMSAASDELLLTVGNDACNLLASESSFGQAIEDETKAIKKTGATAEQTAELIRNAVANLCPQHAAMVP